jgi:Calcineurin-like phosphoesterase
MLAHRPGVRQHDLGLKGKGGRLQRLWTRRACLAAALALAMSAAAAAPSPLHRIVAVGDLHGDFAAWRDIARAAQLVNTEGRWIGGETVLVQTGDVVDRGPDSLKIIQDLMRLQLEAQRAKGQVIALVGNHEAMNLTGDLRYVSAEDYAAYADRRSARRRENVYAANKASIEAAYRQRTPQMTGDAIKQAWLQAYPLGRIEHQIAWSDRGKIGQWIVKNPAIVLLDGNLFVHGGISPAFTRMPIAEINRQVSSALTARSTDPQAIINDPMGPLWYRGLANPDAVDGSPTEAPRVATEAGPIAPPIEDQLKTLLSEFGAKRIVIGHTPILSGIAVLFDGRLIRIDTGISSVYGGKVSYLDIRDGIAVPHVVERSQPPKK